MKIRFKIILSIVSVFLFFLLSVFVFQYFYTREFDNIVKLQSKSLESNINLYIAGDNFFQECNIFYNYNDKNKDSLVLNNIIERIIENYKIYAVYLYSSNNTLIKKSFCDTNISVSIPGDISEISKNFYFTDDSGLYIAKKVNINNVDKISNKEYFLLFIKVMDKETLEEVKNEMAVDNVYISIVDKQQKKFNVDDDNCIIISKPLLNQNSIPVAYLYITKKLSLILNLVKIRNIFYVIFFISVLLLLFVIIFIVNKIINKPLKFISDSLKEGKIINFDKIHKRRDEFSDLAKIIELFFEQKKKIEEEIIKVNYSNEALTLSEKRFFSLFNNSPIGIFQTTIEGKVIIANKYLYSVLGYDDSDFKDIDLKKNLYLYPEQRDVFLKYFYENKFIKDAEINLKKKDNSTVTFIMNAYSVRDKDGNILYIEGTLSDVTEIKKLNEDLYKLKLASMQSLDGIAILNNESKFEYINKSFATMHGYNIDDLIGKHLGLIHSEEQMGLQRIKLKKAVIEKGYFEGEISHLKRDGSFLPTFMSITSIKNINNDIVGWLAITRDITELINSRELIEFLNIQLKKKVYVQNIDLINNNIKLEKTVIELQEKEKVITQSEQLYNSTVNSIKEWLHVVDKDLKFILINTSFKEKLNELNISQDLVNTYLADNFNFIDSEIIMRYQTVFKTGNIDKSEEITNINDNTYYTETVRTPVFDENNNVIRVITVIRDISDRILFEQKLLSAIVKTEEAEKRRFAEDLHDVLGALLSAMKIFVNAAIKKSKTGENIDDLLLQIKEMIIEGVVNIRNIAYNLSPNILNDFGLLKAISNYCDKLNTTSQIKIKFDSHNLNCQLDKIIEINIYRIILELINNTLKHSSAKNINLSLALKKNIIYIDYSDDGIGFNMANNHHNLSFRGMGLNNILARVKLLRGKCNFNSMEGQGFKAHIYFENFNFVV